MTSLPPVSPDQAARYRHEYARRRRTVRGVALGGVLLWIPVMILAGDRDWIRAAYLGAYVTIGILTLGIVWRCPRCHLQFGRAFRVGRCPECGLELEGAQDHGA